MHQDIEYTKVDIEILPHNGRPEHAQATASAWFRGTVFTQHHIFDMKDGRMNATQAGVAIESCIEAIHAAIAEAQPDPFSFDSIGKQAEDGNPAAQLYWMALAKLTSGVHGHEHVHDVHADVVRMAREVYEDASPFVFRGVQRGACRDCGVHVGQEDYCDACASKHEPANPTDAIAHVNEVYASNKPWIGYQGARPGSKTGILEQLVNEAHERGEDVAVFTNRTCCNCGNEWHGVSPKCEVCETEARV